MASTSRAVSKKLKDWVLVKKGCLSNSPAKKRACGEVVEADGEGRSRSVRWMLSVKETFVSACRTHGPI